MMVEVEMARHGSPEDRGRADAYYQRPYTPHYYEGATYNSRRIEAAEMTPDEVREYERGFAEQTASGDFKNWD